MGQNSVSSRALPRLVLIADRFTGGEVADRAAAAVRAGAPWIHLRDHFAASDRFTERGKRLVERLRALNERVLISVNTQLSLASRLEAGLHLGARGRDVAAARRVLGPEAVIGYSAHEGDTSIPEEADYLFFSPVFSTTSKPGHPGTGLDALARVARAWTDRPVFALGGVTPERTAACRDAGAYGVAVVSGILNAPDPAEAVRAYREALGTYEG